MPSKKSDPTSKQSRNFKFLLYPDNPQHIQVLDMIKMMYPEHIGILHNENPERKAHYHIAVSLDKPKMLKTVAKEVGLVSDLGEPDCQFVRLCDGRLSRFLVYLTHLDQPDKEQYTPSQLFGSSGLLADYGKAATKFLRNEIDMADSVLACLDWIRGNHENVVTMTAFARWVCQTPYFKASSSPLVRCCIEEHNQRIYNAYRKEYISRVSDGQQQLNAILQYPEACPDPPALSLSDLDDFEDVIF